jgi:anthranilate phosphoribosyltransferase
MDEAINKARVIIESGAAKKQLETFIAKSNE